LAALLRTADRTVLVDSLTLWLTATMDAVGAWDDEAWDSKAADDKTADDKATGGGQPRVALGGLVSDLVGAYAASASSVVVVSDEIGFGVVPESAGTRRFRDELGRLNQAFAAASDEVSLVVAGLALRLKPGPGSPGSV
jgi:adenosylcobinamide kinase/adenosylcobinamide-phosphate guanylyltransferase